MVNPRFLGTRFIEVAPPISEPVNYGFGSWRANHLATASTHALREHSLFHFWISSVWTDLMTARSKVFHLQSSDDNTGNSSAAMPASINGWLIIMPCYQVWIVYQARASHICILIAMRHTPFPVNAPSHWSAPSHARIKALAPCTKPSGKTSLARKYDTTVTESAWCVMTVAAVELESYFIGRTRWTLLLSKIYHSFVYLNLTQRS